MSVETQTREYKMKRRAELQDATRLKITEATVALHEEFGPARTSISAIAEKAGVRRSTVYRHFPDELGLMQACSAHWMALHPLPDLEAWAAIADPDERLRVALGQLYRRFHDTEAMTEHLLRDERTNDTVRQLFAAYHGYIAAAHEILMAGRGLRGRAKARVSAAIGHAVAFPTWQSLKDQGLDDAGAADLMQRLVAAAAR